MVYKWSIIAGAVCFVGVLMYVGVKPDSSPVDVVVSTPTPVTPAPSTPFAVVANEPEPTPEPIEEAEVLQILPNLVTPSPSPKSLKPIANAGLDITMESLEVVELDGFGTSADGSDVTFQWMTYEQYRFETRGIQYDPRTSDDNDIELLNSDQPNAKFTAPEVEDYRQVFLFLLVTDIDGHWASDALTINIQPRELPNTAFHELDIPDEGLRECINKVANLRNMAFAQQVQKLYCNHADIENLDGIEHLVNLKELNLSHNKIKDVSKLKALWKLNKLFLGHNKVFDLRPLTALKQLYLLSLDNNEIEDISPLAKLHRLIYLDLQHNKVSDLKPLRNFPPLRMLDLSYNYLHEINELTHLENLSVLALGNNPFKRVYALHQLPKLKVLDMRHTENVRCVDLERLEPEVAWKVKRKGDCRL